jgi:type I restriction enzyme S subunit
MRDGWVETTLDGIAEYINGFPFKPTDLGERGTPVIRIKQLLDPNEPVDRTEIETPERYVLRNGDIVFSWSGTLAVRIWNRGTAKLNQHLFRVIEKEGVYKNIIPLILEHALEELEEKSHGTTMKHITKQTLLPHKVFLPPLAEQKRIVDLISSVDSYIEALQQQVGKARKSRNAVLHELLTKGGDGWVETSLDQVAYINPSEPALSSTEHFAPMDAVHIGKRWLQYTEERRDRNGARARAGDVLFARITPCLENGKVAQVQEKYSRCGGSTEFIVIRGSEKCSSNYIYFWSTLKLTREKASELMTGTTGRQRLSASDLGKITFLLPPLAEQKRIVEIISVFDNEIEALDSTITKTKNLRSALLSDLLSGSHEIPTTYDKLIGAA